MKAAVITPTVIFLACIASLTAGERDLPAGIHCPVCDKPVVAEHTADWKGGKVYLECPKCVATFRADANKYAVNANAQLVATGQAKQIACPITGRKPNSDRKVNVGGVDILFCCVGCQGRVAKAKGVVQRYLVFSENAFTKGFRIGK